MLRPQFHFLPYSINVRRFLRSMKADPNDRRKNRSKREIKRFGGDLKSKKERAADLSAALSFFDHFSDIHIRIRRLRDVSDSEISAGERLFRRNFGKFFYAKPFKIYERKVRFRVLAQTTWISAA